MRPVECAVIAGAGLGSRLGHGLPKCMLEIEGSTLLSRLIRNLEPLVPRVHVVVGYREEMVIELCAREHRHVVLVRNPDFRTTNTAESMALGARACLGKTLFLDGDLLIDPWSLREFITAASCHDVLMGVSPTRSEHPVCVEFQEDTPSQAAGGVGRVSGFMRDQYRPYEWANVVAGPQCLMDGVSGFVFERLLDYAPLAAKPIDLREIDTKADLDLAREFARKLHDRTPTI